MRSTPPSGGWLLRHACGFKLANDGHDTRALQPYLGHKNLQHTVRYTEMAPDRFKDFWKRLTLGLGHLGPAASGRRQARDDFRFPLNHLGIRARVPLRDHRLDELDGALDLLITHRLYAAGMLEFQLFRDEHGADLQVARRALPPNPLEHLAPMLLPVLRQIEQKALVERSARSFRRAARVSRNPWREPAVDAAIDDLGGGVMLGFSVHSLHLVLRGKGVSRVSARLLHFLGPAGLSFGSMTWEYCWTAAPVVV